MVSTDMKPTNIEIEARQQEMRRKRIATIVGCYDLLGRQFSDIKKCTSLQESLVAETVEKYLADRERFVARNNIRGRIQRHKVAGLMTAAIAKTKPIYLLEGTDKELRTSKINEIFAVLHGIAVCAEGCSQDQVNELRNSKYFYTWFEDFYYLVNRHPDSADGFILTYETLCLTFFPLVFSDQ